MPTRGTLVSPFGAASGGLERVDARAGKDADWIINFWVKWDGATQYRTVFASLTGQLQIFARTVSAEALSLYDGSASHYTPGTLPPGTWVHVHAQYIAATQRTIFRLDGAVVHDGTGNTGGSELSLDSATTWVLQDDGADGDFDGRIHDLIAVSGATGTAALNYDDASGEWVEYTGSYGTYGFRLDGQNSGDPGEDSSGNGNHFVQTSGGGAVTVDYTDVPPGANPAPGGTGATIDVPASESAASAAAPASATGTAADVTPAGCAADALVPAPATGASADPAPVQVVGAALAPAPAGGGAASLPAMAVGAAARPPSPLGGSASDLPVPGIAVAAPIPAVAGGPSASITTLTPDARFLRAPAAVWFHADVEGFSGLTQSGGRAETARPAPDPADWGVADTTGAQGDDNVDPVTFNVEGDATIRYVGVQAGATPSGVLHELGGDGRGYAAAFDTNGDLVVAAGRGTATTTTDHALFLTLPASAFAGRTVDVYVAIRYWPARMLALVVEGGTVTAVAAGDAPGGYWHRSADPETDGDPWEESWAGGDAGGIGQVGSSGSSVRAGVVTTPFTGTMAGVECWHAIKIDHFFEDGLTVHAWVDELATSQQPRSEPDTSAWGTPDQTWAQGSESFTFDTSVPPRADFDVTFRFAAISAGATPSGLVAESGGAGQGFAVAFDGAGDLVVAAGEGAETATGNGAVFVTLPAAVFAGRTVDLYVSIRNDPARVAVLVVEDGVSVAFAAQDEPTGVFAADGVTVGNWTGGGDGAVGGENPLNGARAGVVTTDFTGSMGTVSAWEGVLLDDFDLDTLDVAQQVNAPVHYEPEFHELFGDWDFGDSGAGYSAPQNVPDEFRNANRGFGMMACHVFEQPGTYTVTFTARKLASVAPLAFTSVTAATTVTVGDALDVDDDITEGLFDATNTIVMCADGDFGGAPAGQQVVYGDDTAYAAALDAARDDQWGRDRALRILLKRGETGISGTWFDNDQIGRAEGHGDKRFEHVYVGTWGTGDPPEVTGITSMGAADAREDLLTSLVFDGVVIQGSYDPVARDYTGPDGGEQLWDLTTPPGGYRLVTRCGVRDKAETGYSLGGRGLDPRQPALVAIHDSYAVNLGRYGIFGATGLSRGASKTALLGLRIEHPANGPKHDQTVTPENPLGVQNHGGARVTIGSDVVVDGCDTFVRLGWSGGGSWPDGTPKIADQPGWRIMSPDGEGVNREARVQITRSVVEGSEFASILNLDQPDRVPYHGNVLIDSCWHVVTPSTLGTSMKSEAGALTIRNTLTTYDHRPDFSSFDLVRRVFAAPRAGVSEADIVREPVRFYGNTEIVVGANNGQTLDGEAIEAPWIEQVIGNNLLYAPDIAGQTGSIDITPIATAEVIAPRFAGRWEMSDPALQSAYAQPAGAGSLRAPLPGSAADDALVAGPVAPHDLLGRPRAVAASLGALEAVEETVAEVPVAEAQAGAGVPSAACGGAGTAPAASVAAAGHAPATATGAAPLVPCPSCQVAVAAPSGAIATEVEVGTVVGQVLAGVPTVDTGAAASVPGAAVIAGALPPVAVAPVAGSVPAAAIAVEAPAPAARAGAAPVVGPEAIAAAAPAPTAASGATASVTAADAVVAALPPAADAGIPVSRIVAVRHDRRATGTIHQRRLTARI